MTNQHYLLLINEEIKKYLLSLQKNERNRIREKLDFLANGLWDSGLVVKKLKGVSEKVVFEARVSRGDRLLFTLGTVDVNTTGVYVWGIIKHDDISKTARNIMPENAPFLKFEPISTEDYEELIIEELPTTYYSQENIEEKTTEDSGPQKWYTVSEEEWRRILLYSGKKDFEIFLYLTSKQEEVLASEPPLLISGTAGSGKTTISVYFLLKEEYREKNKLFLTYSPFLQRFSRRIYDGLIFERDGAEEVIPPDFTVFKDLLYSVTEQGGHEFSRKKEAGFADFQRLFRYHSLSGTYDAELIWEEIRSIIKGAKPSLSLQRYRKLTGAFLKSEMGTERLNELKQFLNGLKNLEFLKKVENSIGKKTNYASFEEFIIKIGEESQSARKQQEYVLSTIGNILEKKENALIRPMLSYQEYLQLGKKRAPNFIFDRRDVYSIAEYYQEKLSESGMFDEIDLTKQATRCMEEAGKETRYDVVVCDEIQDFCDVQIGLLFRLVKDSRNLVFTGDTKQIINPSGFRWEEVKKRFYESGSRVPPLYTLTMNFRCIGNIVRLGNALLDVKRDLVGLTASEYRENWKFAGRPPFLFGGIPEEKIFEKISLIGAGRIILVRNAAEQRKLKKQLDTELVFTVHDAKGLEFDTVFLWKFISGKRASDIWRRIGKGSHIEREHFPHIRHELNLLYVAVTRARNTLIIYDGESPSYIWDMEQLHNHVHRSSEPAALSQAWERISSPEEWEEQARYFYEREHYGPAAECFKNAGNMKMKELAEAYSHAHEHRHDEAAELFLKHGMEIAAAEHFEAAEKFREALSIWKRQDKATLRKKKIDGRIHIIRCETRLHEKEGNYRKAAEGYLSLDEKENAVKCWEKGGDYTKVAEYAFSGKQYTEAAFYYEKAGDFSQAARCYKQAGKRKKAAEHFFKASDYAQAAVMFKALKNEEMLLRCYYKAEDYYQAGKLHRKRKEYTEALGMFQCFADRSDENRGLLLKEAEKYEKSRKIWAALRYAALSMPEKAADLFFSSKEYRLALREAQEAGDTDMCIECHMKLDQPYEAAVLEEEKATEDEDWNRIEKRLKRSIYQYGTYDRKKADKLFREAEQQMTSGEIEKALVRYKAILFPQGIVNAYLHKKDDEAALRYFLDQDLADFGKEYLAQRKGEKEKPRFSSAFIEELVSMHRDSILYYYAHETVDLVFKIFLVYTRNVNISGGENDKQALDALCALLSKMFLYFNRLIELPEDFFKLVLELRHYNVIFSIIRSIRDNKELPATVKLFLEQVNDAAETEDNRHLLACCAYRKGRKSFEEALDELPVNERNWELFRESKIYYQKAVDYFVSKKDYSQAAFLCKFRRDYLQAGSLLEKAEEHIEAARSYREGKLYEHALRCFLKAGDERNAARMYKKVGQLDKAEELLRKKAGPKQLEMF